jgi:hypothetical protein
MKIIQAIEKREDVSPKEGQSKYGDVKYADEKNKKYPIDSEAHVRAAWSYINMPKNAGKYSSADVATIKGRIKAAGKKYGIDFSDDGDKTEASLVYAAAVDLEGETPSEIVFMPKTAAEGITITPMVGGRAKTVSLKVDESVAELLQAGLTRRLAEEIEPYAGFDHRPGPASFHPKEFKWDEDRGVILEIDWTQAGKDAVSGRNYKYLSPTFMYDGKNVAGLPEIGEVGSLTNNPAIRYKTMKIAASADDDEGEESKMVKLTDKLVELEVITAEQAADADEEFLVRAVTGLHEALATVQAANARLVSENTALAAKAIEVQKAEATTIVQAAIAEGKIPAKNQDAIDFWMGQLIANPEQAKKAMAATLQANPLLQKVIDVKVSDTKKVAQGQSAADLVQAQHLAVAEIQAANPNLSYTDAFNKARRDKPDIFLAEV